MFDDVEARPTRDDPQIGGYSYAVDHLFSQANSWVSAVVKKQPVEYDENGPLDNGDRASNVAVALGFSNGALHPYGPSTSASDSRTSY